MSKFPSLAATILAHRFERCSVSSATESYQWWKCTGCDFESEYMPIKGVNWELLQAEIHAEHAADAWRSACEVRTVEQLDALPNGAIVRKLNGGCAYGKDSNNNLSELYGEWVMFGFEVPESAGDVPLPALLIWTPDWERP